jgi:hypothetical protein
MSAGGVGQAAFAGRPRFLPAVPPALTAALAASFAALLCMLSPPGGSVPLRGVKPLARMP